MRERWVGFIGALALFGCMTDTERPGSRASAGPTVGVNVAALNLQDVGDVVWDVEVVNGEDPAQVVWQKRLASSALSTSLPFAPRPGLPPTLVASERRTA